MGSSATNILPSFHIETGTPPPRDYNINEHHGNNNVDNDWACTEDEWRDMCKETFTGSRTGAFDTKASDVIDTYSGWTTQAKDAWWAGLKRHRILSSGNTP